MYKVLKSADCVDELVSPELNCATMLFSWFHCDKPTHMLASTIRFSTSKVQLCSSEVTGTRNDLDYQNIWDSK